VPLTTYSLKKKKGGGEEKKEREIGIKTKATGKTERMGDSHPARASAPQKEGKLSRNRQKKQQETAP